MVILKAPRKNQPGSILCPVLKEFATFQEFFFLCGENCPSPADKAPELGQDFGGWFYEILQIILRQIWGGGIFHVVTGKI